MAHELGHSLGMKHDFVGNNENKLKNNPSGKGKCKGVMDYKESTNGWSKCSLADIKKFLNGLKKNCLIREYSLCNILKLHNSILESIMLSAFLYLMN